jgi:hypothetical protein
MRWGNVEKPANSTRTSGVEPEMQMIGAMIVSWIIYNAMNRSQKRTRFTEAA